MSSLGAHMATTTTYHGIEPRINQRTERTGRTSSESRWMQEKPRKNRKREE